MNLHYNRDGVTVALILDQRTANKDGLYPVKVRVYYLRKPKYFSTGVCMSPTEWEKLARSKSNESIKIRHTLQKSFDNIKSNVETLIDQGEFSLHRLDLRIGRAVGESINKAINARIEELKKEERVGTASSFANTLKAIERFAGADIAFSDITVEWLQRCERFWQKENRSISTIGMDFRNIRTMMNIARTFSIIKMAQYPFGKGKFEIRTEEGIKKALDKEQINAIFNYRSANDTTNKYKDFWMLLFLCSGINTVDLIQLKYSEIVEGEIHFIRQKTSRTSKHQKVIKIALTPEIEAIISKWGNIRKPDNYIFPFLKGGESAQQIKDAAHFLIQKINKRMKLVCEDLGIPKVTTYAARHSYATILCCEGVSIPFISEQLGHTSIKTTQIYLAGFGKKDRQDNAQILTSILH